MTGGSIATRISLTRVPCRRFGRNGVACADDLGGIVDRRADEDARES